MLPLLLAALPTMLPTAAAAGKLKNVLMIAVDGPPSKGRRLETVIILLTPPSTFGRCFNMDRQGVSSKCQSRRRL